MGIMSENSELIHWHLQPRSAALLVQKKAVLWHLTSSVATVLLSLQCGRLGGKTRFKGERPVCFIGLTFIYVSHRRFRNCFNKPDLAKKALRHYCMSVFKLFPALIKNKDLFLI